jgi:hypothetical protein
MVTTVDFGSASERKAVLRPRRGRRRPRRDLVALSGGTPRVKGHAIERNPAEIQVSTDHPVAPAWIVHERRKHSGIDGGGNGRWAEGGFGRDDGTSFHQRPRSAHFPLILPGALSPLAMAAGVTLFLFLVALSNPKSSLLACFDKSASLRAFSRTLLDTLQTGDSIRCPLQCGDGPSKEREKKLADTTGPRPRPSSQTGTHTLSLPHPLSQFLQCDERAWIGPSPSP